MTPNDPSCIHPKSGILWFPESTNNFGLSPNLNIKLTLFAELSCPHNYVQSLLKSYIKLFDICVHSIFSKKLRLKSRIHNPKSENRLSFFQETGPSNLALVSINPVEPFLRSELQFHFQLRLMWPLSREFNSHGNSAQCFSQLNLITTFLPQKHYQTFILNSAFESWKLNEWCVRNMRRRSRQEHLGTW